MAVVIGHTSDGLQAGKYNVKLDTTGQKAKFHVKTLNGTAPEITDYALECSSISANLNMLNFVYLGVIPVLFLIT